MKEYCSVADQASRVTAFRFIPIQYLPRPRSLALLVISLIIDTGGSNIQVEAERPYVRTQTSVDTYNAVVSNKYRGYAKTNSSMPAKAYVLGPVLGLWLSGWFFGKLSLTCATFIVSTFPLRYRLHGYGDDRASGLVIPGQSIGVTLASKGLEGLGGILG
jgi:hypothetical protein